MDAVGHMAEVVFGDGTVPEHAPHLAADLGVELGDGVDVAGGLHRQHGHAEVLALVVRVFAAERGELVPVDLERLLHGPEEEAGEVGREAVVTGRHRRVGRDEGALPDPAKGVAEGGAAGDALGHQLERGEGAVALVEVEDGRVDAERAEHAHAANAEDHLLTGAHGVVARVETATDLAVFGAVLCHIGVEQEEGDAADGERPDLRADNPVGDGDGDDERSIAAEHQLGGRLGPVGGGVGLLLQTGV